MAFDPPQQQIPVPVKNSDAATSVRNSAATPVGNFETPLNDEAGERLQWPNARLLVSVRNLTEAIAALQGGADIIDVKEPRHGALGRADTDVIRSIAELLRPSHRTSGLSVALGELTELSNAGKSVLCEIISALVPGRDSFVKIGLAGAASMGSQGWQSQWLSIRDEFGDSNQWVAVAYADHIRAGSPTPLEICEFAIRNDCRAFLIDTFLKDNKTLKSWLSVQQLSELIQSAHGAGLIVALAGSVGPNDLSQLIPLQPDLIAVRGAVCEGSLRLGSVSADRVAEFRRAMLNC